MLLVMPAFGVPVQHALPDHLDLPRLLDLAAERLDLPIQYDARHLQGTPPLTLRIDRSLSDDELWALANQLLALNALTTVRPPGAEVVSVVRLADAAASARIGVRNGGDAGYVTVLLEAEHRKPEQLVEAIKPLLSKPAGAVSAVPGSRLILISDLTPRVDQIVELMDQIDVVRQPAVVERVPVEFLTATQLVGLVQASATTIGAMGGEELAGKIVPVPDGDAVVIIAPERELPQWMALIDRFDARQSVVSRTYAPTTFALGEVVPLLESVARDPSPRGSGDRWQVVTDDLTGTLIVTATASEHEQVERILDRLASVPAAAQRPVRAFPIRNRGVTELLEVMSSLLEAGVLEGGGLAEALPVAAEARQQTRRDVLPPGLQQAPNGRPVPEAPTARPAPRGPEAPPALTLTADTGTNTLIAVGEPRRLEQLANLIELLDVRQPQVVLEVLVVNLTDAETLDLGVELEKMEVSGGTIFRLASLFGLGTPGINTVTPPTASGGTAVVLDPGDFRVLVRALETLNEGRTLNVPKVLVNNNQAATLDSVLQQPFTATNASDTVATTSFGGTQDAGTTMTVTPQIAEGDHLVLEYSVSLSSFVGESADPSLPPPRLQNTLASVVTIPDGFTVAVGGLDIVTEAEAESRVPLLGALPLIGAAFKSRSLSDTRSRFYVFIKPTILRDPGFEDLKYLSDQDLTASGIDDGWPEVEPRIIR